MLNEKLLHLQLALFFAENESRPDKYIPMINDVSGGIFDQMPVILPIPNDAPPEIPVITMKSSNGINTCNIARSRIDYIMTFGDNKAITHEKIENFISQIKPFAALMFGNKNIVRFGFVAQYFIETGDAVKYIQSKYFKHNPGNLEELGIKYNKKFQVDKFSVNDVIEINAGSFMNLGHSRNGILIQRDLNNVPNDSLLQIDDMLSIIKMRLSEYQSDGIMELVR